MLMSHDPPPPRPNGSSPSPDPRAGINWWAVAVYFVLALFFGFAAFLRFWR